MAPKKFLVEVEKAKEAKDGRPSTGPVYRSLFAKGGFPEPIEGMESCWDVFRYGFLCICLVAEKARRPEKKKKKNFFEFLSVFVFVVCGFEIGKE